MFVIDYDPWRNELATWSAVTIRLDFFHRMLTLFVDHNAGVYSDSQCQRYDTGKRGLSISIWHEVLNYGVSQGHHVQLQRQTVIALFVAAIIVTVILSSAQTLFYWSFEHQHAFPPFHLFQNRSA